MIKLTKNEQKLLSKLEEFGSIKVTYDDLYNRAWITNAWTCWCGTDELTPVKLNKKDCLKLSSIFIKLAQNIIDNEPKVGELKVKIHEKEVEVIKEVPSEIVNTWVASLSDVGENGVITASGVIGNYTNKQDLIDSLIHNGYVEKDTQLSDYIKVREDGTSTYAIVKNLSVKDEF